MGARASSEAAAVAHIPDADEDIAEELRRQQQVLDEKRRRYARLSSEAVRQKRDKKKNVIEDVYEEDFETIDHIQALRFPPMVVKELKDAVANEAERRCAEVEKTMARCLQDKMWTTWKCQKERDRYTQCVDEKKRDNELLMAYRWKYKLGTLHGEIIGRDNMMRRIWHEHFPDRELPHPWVKDR
ncbi:hypothetical protein C3747_84g38 [Trypanosoma cruzi]|uniref:COX assembly mitochondrial protein n=2 Tax=Trypanosoma cruzi TaxID=5693 RepID=Q4DZE9_TRYCC|nr:hypothetical protein, conserved [Trypanosoma cruzi]EAN97904.1 hypothetical protein, conserved [Trypanosoma cruzi]KAF8302657.1 putative Cytochrome c oxidase biogenesis protein Cmc1 like [Trypanosoma cruzi]PWV08911.1 hypothetical protein C3747_84g38 [Trypanosoma cruzi]RNC60053.1 hypothetical protein TcCL_ESM02269 [Trypanosoma cruzi]|eukprot:XP_819755.1 hypothetical protein [Trypanosoma cruzi strain CL Brener]